MSSSAPERQTAPLTLPSEPAASSGKPCLVVVSGSDAGRRIDLNDDELLVGRASDCAIVIDNDSVSRHHATLVRVMGRWIVIDQQSTNGTFLNNRRVERTELKDGELLRIGKVALKYVSNRLELDYLDHVLNVANTDALTGAFSRSHFDGVLATEVESAKLTRKACSLVLLDVDHFKSINDAFGHSTGDSVLKNIASVAQSQMRQHERLFRIGGEEFALVLSDTPLALARQIAELVRVAVETVVCLAGDVPVQATLSLGVAELRSDERPEELFQRADARLYSAKRAGRNRVH